MRTSASCSISPGLNAPERLATFATWRVIDGDQALAGAAVVKPAAAHVRVAQRAEHAYASHAASIQRPGDSGDLPLDCVELAGAVAAVDEQLLATLKNAGRDDLYFSAAAFAVDDGHSAGADRDVVDVRAALAGDPAVVDHDHVAASQPPGQLACGSDLPAGALLPGLDGGGVCGDAGEQRSGRAVAGCGPLATGAMATLMFALGAAPGDTGRTLICEFHMRLEVSSRTGGELVGVTPVGSVSGSLSGHVSPRQSSFGSWS
jgi:hypothetical protein